MEWSLENVLVHVALAIAVILGLMYSYITRRYDYWKNRNIPYAQPSFPFGNIKDLIFARCDMGRFYERYYNQFKKEKYGGIFELHKPTLIVTDLDLVRLILSKDFAHFVDRDIPLSSSNDFITKHLLTMRGKEWKDMRSKLTPTFSSGKIKLMYTLIEKCSEQLAQYLEPFASKEEVIDVKELMSRFTLDIIATCAFGVEVNTLKDSQSEFLEISNLIVKPQRTLLLKIFLMTIFPKLGNLVGLSFVHPKVKEFFFGLIKTTVTYREKQNVTRNDFLDLLIKVKNNDSLKDGSVDENEKSSGSTKEGLTLQEMTGQAFIFFAAGFETAASTTTFVLYELARNPEIQKKLRWEIDKVIENHDGKITYQALQELTYMEQVLNETLRLHGSVPNLLRKCVEPYTIPDTNVTLDRDIKVLIPSYAIHHDPDIYPDPQTFDPERFSEENIKSRHHYSFLAFGEGPRMCIGNRFGKMQVKAGLSTIIANFELSMTADTPVPIEISPRAVITTPIHPIKLCISRRSN